MADDELNVLTATGAQKTIRSRDTALAGKFSQMTDVAPWLPTIVSGAQYALVIGTTATTLTVPSGATHAMVSVESGDVRFTEDGATPTATSGILLSQGTVAELALPVALKFIRASGSTASTINVSYRRYI